MTAPPRHPLAGTATVVRFNWPKYAGTAVLVAVAVAAARLGLPAPIVAPLGAAAGLGTVWAAASLVATWWVYDHRHVGDQVVSGLGDLGDWAGVHLGFDDTTRAVGHAIGRAPVAVVELPVPARPSLRRARAGGAGATVAGRPGSLPLAGASLDAVVITFAAHEVRDRADQQALFAEIRRVLRPGGRLVVTEHLRDLANVAVYGPGALHFLPRATYADRAGEAGLVPDGETAITPFVHRMVWRR